MKRLKLSSMFVAVALLLGACASEPPNPLIGAWLLTISTPVGEMAANLDVNPDLTGTMSSDDLGAAALDNLTLTGDEVSFETTIDAQGQVLTLGFAGEMADDGNSFSGTFSSDFGPIPAAAVRR